jgi:hypothetical protein
MFVWAASDGCLGYTVSGGKDLVSSKKVEAVKEWPIPQTPREVCCFVQFCNFYAKFIHHFNDFLTPLTFLLEKLKPQRIVMTPTCMEAFETPSSYGW